MAAQHTPLSLEPGEIAATLKTEPPTPIALRRFLNDGWSGFEIRFLSAGNGRAAGEVASYGTGSIELKQHTPDGWCPRLDAARARRAAIWSGTA